MSLRTRVVATFQPKEPEESETNVSAGEGVTPFLPPLCELYLETTRRTKEPGFILPRRSPGAGGSKSAAGRKMLWVFWSRPMVRADFFVATFSTTVYLSGESSWMTVRLPSPQEANA